MPTTGGSFSLVPSYKATSGQTIRTEQHNPPLEDIAVALTERLPRDGSAPMTGNLPMNGQKITNLGAGTAASDALRRDQATLYSAYLSSVAGLALEANTIPYATAAGVAAKTALTAVARTLLAQTTAAEQRTALGVAEVIDEDSFATNSATRPPSQQSTKAYVDASAGKAIGVGQTWIDRTGSRSSGTAYRNTSGRPISVIITHTSAGSGNVSVSNTGLGYTDIAQAVISATGMIVSFVVPDGVYYKTTGNISRWVELS